MQSNVQLRQVHIFPKLESTGPNAFKTTWFWHEGTEDAPTSEPRGPYPTYDECEAAALAGEVSHHD